jgi:hypothetical protein
MGEKPFQNESISWPKRPTYAYSHIWVKLDKVLLEVFAITYKDQDLSLLSGSCASISDWPPDNDFEMCLCNGKKTYRNLTHILALTATLWVKSHRRGWCPTRGACTAILDHFALDPDHFGAILDHFAANLDHFHGGFDMP